MKNVKISLQKAVWILRLITIKNGTLGPIDEAMYEVLFGRFKAGQEILLKTGAKLMKYPEGIFLCGYAQDGHDVECYFKKKEVKNK